jgi:hypothetical protein
MIQPLRIMHAVSEHFGIAVADLHSSGRACRVVAARHIAAHLMRTHCSMSYPEIGRAVRGLPSYYKCGASKHATFMRGSSKFHSILNGDGQWWFPNSKVSVDVRQALAEIERTLGIHTEVAA